MTDMGIFEGYMEIQYKEGIKAKIENKTLNDNPYNSISEMGKAWIDGYNEDAFTQKDIEF